MTAPTPAPPPPCPNCRGPLEELAAEVWCCQRRECSIIKFGAASELWEAISQTLRDQRLEILQCFREQQRLGERSGSGGSGGRFSKKRRPACNGPRPFYWDEPSGPVGRPDPKERFAPDYTREGSKVVSVRLDEEQRAQLERLAARHGSPASAFRAALAGLEALNHARDLQNAQEPPPEPGAGR